MNVGVYILKRYTMNSKATSKQSLKKKTKVLCNKPRR